MAVNTTNTILKSASTKAGVYTKLCDIVSYPDMGSTPSKLDTTDLTATQFKTQIFGLQELPDLTFDCNYDETALSAINAMTGKYYFSLNFGTADGKFTWYGAVKAYANGGGVDEVRKMTVVCSVEYVADTTGIEFATT